MGVSPPWLRDVSARDISVTLLGRRLPRRCCWHPSVCSRGHRHADVAVAAAASATHVPLIFSTQAVRPMETCAAVMGDAPRWSQLYVSQSRGLCSASWRDPVVVAMLLKGVLQVIGNLLADFELTMALAGCRSTAEITGDWLVPVMSAG